MPGCLFCDIVAGEVDADVVLATEHMVGFLDHRPLIK
jgi:histidine triad (HIT) family protein